MTILAIETSMGQASLALLLDDPAPSEAAANPQRLFTLGLPRGEPIAEKLVPLLDSLMNEAGIGFDRISRVAVCVGPGGFSGIRAGVALAAGIGLAARVPVVGATSFRLMLESYLVRRGDGEPHQPFTLVAAAGTGAYYCQNFSALGVASSDIAYLTATEAAEALDQTPGVLAGPGLACLGNSSQRVLMNVAPDLFPEAATLAAIATSLDPDRDRPIPYYIRPPDAKAQSGHVVPRRSDDSL